MKNKVLHSNYNDFYDYMFYAYDYQETNIRRVFNNVTDMKEKELDTFISDRDAIPKMQYYDNIGLLTGVLFFCGKFYPYIVFEKDGAEIPKNEFFYEINDRFKNLYYHYMTLRKERRGVSPFFYDIDDLYKYEARQNQKYFKNINKILNKKVFDEYCMKNKVYSLNIIFNAFPIGENGNVSWAYFPVKPNYVKPEESIWSVSENIPLKFINAPVEHTEAYQEILMYTARFNEKNIPEVCNNTKIKKAGFDIKKSFRKTK